VRHFKKISRSAVIVASSVMALGAVIVLGILIVSVLNYDLYGRSDELKTVYGWPDFPRGPNTPEITVRIVIHRLLEDENSAELSAIVEMDPSELTKLAKQHDETLTILVRDGSSMQPFDLGASIIIPVDPVKYRSKSIESERFRLPILPSIGGFPFDDVSLYIPVYVHGSNGLDYDFHLEIQKAFPGRLLETGLNRGETPRVVLSRSPLQKTLVMATSVIFLLVCVVVATKLFSKSTNFSGLEQILAVAAFLVACGEFRNFLDVPKTGTSALEIAIFVIPMSVLALGFALTTIRSHRSLISPD
jgi:hypothetical protein